MVNKFFNLVKFLLKYRCCSTCIVNLSVLAPALVIHPPSYSFGVQNERVYMTCVAYGVPLPKITWTRNDSIDIDPNAITEMNLTVNGTVFSVSILEFCAVDMPDIAWYNCTAANGVSGSGVAESTAQFFLHVLEAATGSQAMGMYGLKILVL